MWTRARALGSPRLTRTWLRIGAVALATAAIFTFPTAAQGPQGGPQGPGGFGGPGFQGRMPFVGGTVADIDASQNLLLVRSPFGGDQVVKVMPNTKLVTQTTATVADLKVGDQVQIQGQPTAITANSLGIGGMPDFMRMGPQPGGPGQQQGGARQPQNAMAFAMANGTVKSVSPLTIAVGSDVTITIKLAPNARLTKMTPVQFSAIKENDNIFAAGQEDSEGVFVATGVGVNLNLGGPGMGPGMGPGRPGGPGGQPGAGGGRPGGGQPAGR